MDFKNSNEEQDNNSQEINEINESNTEEKDYIFENNIIEDKDNINNEITNLPKNSPNKISAGWTIGSILIGLPFAPLVVFCFLMAISELYTAYCQGKENTIQIIVLASLPVIIYAIIMTVYNILVPKGHRLNHFLIILLTSVILPVALIFFSLISIPIINSF